MKLRKAALLLLLISVVAPIVLYTDTLATYLSSSTASSENEFVAEEVFQTFGGEIRPLNVLPQDSVDILKEPLGIVYNVSDAADNARKTRQLTQDSLQQPPSNHTQTESVDENPIREVTDKPDIQIVESTGVNKLPVVAATTNSQILDNAAQKMQITAKRHSYRHPVRKGAREQVDVQTASQKEQLAALDVRVRQLKDQLIRAKVYLSLSATRNNPHYVRELRLRMKEVQRGLGDATKDTELPRNALEKLNAMELTLAKGKQIQDDCAAVVKKLRAMLHSTEEQLRVHKKQALYLTHLTAKTLPKGLHCLPLRLSTEYFSLNSSQQQFPNEDNLQDPSLYHYALFSDNVLAAAVVVNSTISHAKDTSKHVFHIVTDRLNYASMRMWFLANPPQNASIQVQNVEEFTWLNSSYSPVLKQLGSPSMIDYYFKARRAESDSNLKFRNPKYLSIMNHLRFYLPQIFPKLDKVLFLDDDIVVQKDLSNLWSLNLKGKVIGVVETCGESFHRFDRYLNFSNPLISRKFDPRACGWAFGMNIVDLAQWRRQNITDVYHSWQNLNHDRQLWKLGTLPPGLITFWNQTYALDRFWHVLGLGYNPNVSQRDIDKAAVVHYNGNLKPWLEIGIPKFRSYWAKYVDYDQIYLRECNITP